MSDQLPDEEFVERWWSFLPDAFKQQFNDEFYALFNKAYEDGHVIGQDTAMDEVESMVRQMRRDLGVRET